nr:TetR-like C-terminal domain-containing protein [Pseudonocardia sp. C8]
MVCTRFAAGDDPDTRQARDRYWASRYERARQMITRAVDRGELADTTDPRLVLEMLVGPVHFKAVLTREAIDPGMPRRLVDALLDGVARSTPATDDQDGDNPDDGPAGATAVPR